ncbi:GNAT family N-acetyltransferase [Roseibacterium sp. SDUM158017]|uniref:GNAT family N-acetyltransferase n=1 Tax=Roseicyclus salinarum TaxID=3036773 RepID=UPI0024157041|nr:GNAT family N-acetyltransferase [Roseibacterium sp. SDUM158017]MDG4649844.1 GNAT family N-acetyltransferase [Roseibacterium sp. SDUM158017]
MRRASACDREAIEAFLRRDPAHAMFPLSNLLRHGLGEGPGRAMNRGALRGVLGVTGDGMILPVCPATAPQEMARALAGRRMIGIMGAGPQVRPLAALLGLDGADRALDEDEAQFVLDLDDLVVPGGPGRLVPLADLDAETRVAWRRDYCIETLGTPPERAAATAEADVAHYLSEGSHRALIDGGMPLAMTGFNARLPDIVQVGAVYTPPALRNRGHARRAVALHLAEARDAGVRRATLFTSGPAAIRAYEALGFRRSGTWTVILPARPEVIHG